MTVNALIHRTEQGVASGPIDARCEESLCRLLRRRTGIVIRDHQLKSLRNTVYRACARFGYRRCEDYVTALEWVSETSREMEHLIAGITVVESYFFRERTQIEFLRTTWMPQVISAKQRTGEKSLRIWSAGCAAGQEVYTLAILMREALPDIEAWTVHLMGMDINTEALGHAIRGRYSEWSFRATSDETRTRYFSRHGDEYEVSSGLRGMVSFAYLNLVDDSFPSMLNGTNALDLIVCRNVFIYFDRDIVGQVLNKFSACLVPGGCLLLGASDPVDTAIDGLTLHRHDDIFCFRRAEPVAPRVPAISRPVRTRQPSSSIRARPLVPKRKIDRRTIAARHATGANVRSPEPRQPDAAQAEAHGSIIKLLRQEHWREAVGAVDARIAEAGENAILLQLKAKALASLGDAATALDLCLRSLALDAMDKHTHLIMALVLLELGRLREAEQAFRKAIYLDRLFVEAHFQLGLLRLRIGSPGPGMKCLRTALAMAEAGDPDREVHGAPGTTYGRLAEILKSEIDIYEGEYAGALQ